VIKIVEKIEREEGGGGDGLG